MNKKEKDKQKMRFRKSNKGIEKKNKKILAFNIGLSTIKYAFFTNKLKEKKIVYS